MQLELADLRESNAFLNDLYDNVTSAIFIADGEPRIFNFNDSFKTLFYREEDQILKELCGNAMGCIFQVDSGSNCGETEYCGTCVLRKSILKTFTKKVPIYKEPLLRKFYINGAAIEKHFVFTTKYASYQNREMILVIVEDVTDLEEKKQALEEKNRLLQSQKEYLENLIQEKVSETMELNVQLSRESLDKATLIQEVQHRVGNNLQIINSLLRLQAITDHDVDSAVRETESRLAAIKELYDRLVHDGTVSIVNVSEYFQAIAEHVAQKDSRGIVLQKLDWQMGDTFLNLDIAFPLGLIAHELFNIIIRKTTKGFQPKKSSFAMKLDLKQEEYGELELQLPDIGLSSEPGGETCDTSADLSLKLISILARQLDGSCQIRNDGKSKVIVKFTL